MKIKNEETNEKTTVAISDTCFASSPLKLIEYSTVNDSRTILLPNCNKKNTKSSEADKPRPASVDVSFPICAATAFVFRHRRHILNLWWLVLFPSPWHLIEIEMMVTDKVLQWNLSITKSSVQLTNDFQKYSL